MEEKWITVLRTLSGYSWLSMWLVLHLLSKALTPQVKKKGGLWIVGGRGRKTHEVRNKKMK